MKRKILAMLLCVALTFAIFGTLAVAAEENVAAPQTDAPVCTCGTQDGTHAETCALYAKHEAQQTPVCTCGTEDGTHAETCALYVKPEVQPAPEEKKEEQEEKKEETPAEPAPSVPTCTCATQDGTHAEGCALYVAPVTNPGHTGTCSDTCETQDCPCLCHIVAKLLATTNVEEFYTLAETLTQEQLETLTQEQLEQISAHLASIEPQPAPPIVLEESEPPVESEVYTPTKNYTNVAPFGDPVTGK